MANLDPQVSGAAGSNGPEARPKKVIVDTDPGVDDAMAILCLHYAEQVQLHSLTTVFGNCAQRTSALNAQYLVERFGLGVPVVPGANGPIEGKRHIPQLRVHGKDGFGDAGIAKLAKVPSPKKRASDWIAEAILAEPGEVSILAIAPLTNLAQALRDHPEIVDAVREVVIMGGGMGSGKSGGNITPYAEANFFYDPVAADEVLGARWPIKMVGLDVSNDCILPSNVADAMPRNLGALGSFLRRISVKYEQIYRHYDAIDGFAIHDVAAAMCLIEPELFEFDTAKIGVAIDGEERGRSSIREQDKRAPVLFGKQVQAERLVQRFLRILESGVSAFPKRNVQGAAE